MSTVSCVIIEDNEFDRKTTEQFVQQIPFLELKGRFENALEARSFIRKNDIKLLLMDIDMPLINGLDFYKSMYSAPLCIFITAHPEFALEGFESHVFDYIVKPMKFQRFEQAAVRAKEYLEIKAKAELYDIEFKKNTLLIKEGTSTIQLKIADIIYLEALGDYTKVITDRRMYLTLHSLKSFIEKLPEEKFLRIHRSFAVSVDKIKVLKNNELLMDNVKLPVGKTFRRVVSKYLVPN